ncbi:hypothetical protein CNY89_29435, partial [Amaricoccus sp. HAR-UPW-R2A-40]
DFPESQLQIAGIGLQIRNWQLAQTAFQEAATLDPQLVGAALAASADFPESQLQIAGIGLQIRNWQLAQTAFQEAATL